MIDCLGEADAFLAMGDPELELALIGMDACEKAAGADGRKCGEGKSLEAQIAIANRDPVTRTSTIVARPVSREQESRCCHDRVTRAFTGAA